MQQLAHALQSSLGRQVIDETGLTGWYNLEFGWEENRVKSVTAVLRERFGLELAPGKRDMDTLIVDHIRRDAAPSAGRPDRRMSTGRPAHRAGSFPRNPFGNKVRPPGHTQGTARRHSAPAPDERSLSGVRA